MVDYKIRTQIFRRMKGKINKENQVRRMDQVKIQMKKRKMR